MPHPKASLRSRLWIKDRQGLEEVLDSLEDPATLQDSLKRMPSDAAFSVRLANGRTAWLNCTYIKQIVVGDYPEEG